LIRVDEIAKQYEVQKLQSTPSLNEVEAVNELSKPNERQKLQSTPSIT
jgi:hypothetical protein